MEKVQCEGRPPPGSIIMTAKRPFDNDELYIYLEKSNFPPGV